MSDTITLNTPQNADKYITTHKPLAEKSFSGKITDLVGTAIDNIQKAPTIIKDYIMEPARDDQRSIKAKFLDASISLVTSPTIAFNLANIAFNVSQNNKIGAVISGAMTVVSSGMTVLDSVKNRAESSSYKANAVYQGALGLTFIPKLLSGNPAAMLEAGKGIGLYGLATAGHWLRSDEEEEARQAGKTMDEYYKSFSKGPTKYSQSYYGATEFIAVNAGHNPSAIASIIVLAGIGRALNDKKFWDAEKGPLKNLQQATAPRIFAAGYAISTGAALLSGDFWFAASQAAWGWGNLNFDLVGPKVKKAIKKHYANDPNNEQKALKGLETIKEHVAKLEQETAAMIGYIQEEKWEDAAQEASRLYDAAEGDITKQKIYLEAIKSMAPASQHAQEKLDMLDIVDKDSEQEAIKTNKPSYVNYKAEQSFG